MTSETERLLIDLLAEMRSIHCGFPMKSLAAGELAARIMEALIENSAREIADEEFDRRITKTAGQLRIQPCPQCGSGDVGFDSISVRPHCKECHHWGQVNYGTAEDAIRAWNSKSEATK